MAGFANVRTLVSREDVEGASVITSFRKSPIVTTAAGYWLDLTMSPGNPKPFYYASTPLEGVAMSSATGGIFHGANVSPSTLHLRSLMVMTALSTAVPLPMTLCDYLMYYPFIDEGVVGEEQAMNPGVITPVTIPRYTTGDLVQMIAVVVGPHVENLATFNVRYTNSAGVPNRTSQTVKMQGTQFVNGTILTAAPAVAGCFGPFIPLQFGDTGVQSVEGVTILTTGDVGLFTIVLVRPLADLCIRGIDAPVEVDYFIDRPSLPRVYDGACLNFLVYTPGTINAASIHGLAKFVWS